MSYFTHGMQHSRVATWWISLVPCTNFLWYNLLLEKIIMSRPRQEFVSRSHGSRGKREAPQLPIRASQDLEFNAVARIRAESPEEEERAAKALDAVGAEWSDILQGWIITSEQYGKLAAQKLAQMDRD
jgi:hypothetical protein